MDIPPCISHDDIKLEWATSTGGYSELYRHRSTSGGKHYFTLRGSYTYDMSPQTAGGSSNSIWFRSGDINQIGIFVTDHPIVLNNTGGHTDYEAAWINPPGIEGGRRWVAKVPEAKTSYYNILLKSQICGSEGLTTVTGDCSTLTPAGAPTWISAEPRNPVYSARIGHTTSVANRSAYPYANSTEGRGRADACNSPKSYQIWYSFDKAELAKALTASAEGGSKSYAYTHNDFLESLHQYNPADVIRGVRDNYRNPLVNEQFYPPHPNYAVWTDLPDQLPTLLNGGMHLYFAVRVNFSRIDTTSAEPTATVMHAGEWSDIQEFVIQCGTSSPVPNADCGWRHGL